jgi:WD40 repeat protein
MLLSQGATLSKLAEVTDLSSEMRATVRKGVTAHLSAQCAVSNSCSYYRGSMCSHKTDKPITAVTRTNYSVIVGHADGSLSLWSMQSTDRNAVVYELKHSVAAHADAVTSICAIPSFDVTAAAIATNTDRTAEPVAAVIACSADGTVKTWSAPTLQLMHEFKPSCVVDNLVVVENTVQGNIVLL